MEIGQINSMYSEYLNTINEGSDVGSNAKKVTANSTDDELMSVCKDFEAYFLEQVFKGMEKTVMKADDTEKTTITDYFKDSALQKISEEAAEGEGLGLAQMLYEQMKRNYEL